MSLMVKPICISLCDFSGNWSKPWEETHQVIRVDLKHGSDVRFFEFINKPIDAILAAPPCTSFALSGAQYWKTKDIDGRTAEGLALVDACCRIIAIHDPRVWALENPVGRLIKWLGPYHHIFHPCEYAGWADKPAEDAYKKKTCLWGNFAIPDMKPVEPIRVCAQGSWLQKLGGSSEKTKELRSMTPKGFSRAFYEANKSDV